ncbi:phosphomannomutase [Marinomonas mediterranea]|jgi:Phosphomannomutase|uniref:Phosphoglucomutase/phosphomannomutase alpha/beta/alpha domain I n=1 Tax=Marinomonas mediterranea (strain ATCC 700492 / JCM 21426 / NBRC 103028 / MMB-1) TaxID=717774 RepID=F2K174_MARM1|nr:phosphomannomutase [Marinomonas mediterranea]ADZ89924.1 phosphoglucomutase/phosphomannomutase alpha/beta/alpha domain I [Marinomonas mediterranea MMB-1]WCN08008.1 phosphomannomutase [Marinomonas mediterranea]WCN12103.1 phosphomannomutase [Marinomonas mediterranea]WCN16140.1 phosphomannomutase [Marinomonas mediterranea MMB-1]
MTTLNELSKNNEVNFGTSGVRALVENLSPIICYEYTRAFLTLVCPTAKSIAIGIDLRPSSTSIAEAIMSAAEDLGINIIYCGKLPTPALAYFAMTLEIPAIMVTGSHIPFDRNGFKFYTPKGEITKAHEKIILSSPLIDNNSLKKRTKQNYPLDTAALKIFKERYTSIFPKSFLAGKRIGVYEHSSVARDIIKSLLSHFGAEVISLERTSTFVPIDTEAVSKEDQIKALNWSEEHNLDAIVSTDGDGDRPLISDENGHWLRGDIVGILVSQYLGATHISCPINANTALELSSPNLKTLRTRIGSPYVLEGMEQLAKQAGSSVVGYEANGGVLIGSNFEINGAQLNPLATRDSILPILTILASSVENKISIRKLVNRLPQRFTSSDRIKNISNEQSQNIISGLIQNTNDQCKLLNLIGINETVSIRSLNEVDGLRMQLSNNMIIHLRQSGNAPELRCYSETNDQKTSDTIVTTALEQITCFL